MAIINGRVVNPSYQAMWPVAIKLEFALSEIATTFDGLVVTTQKQTVIPSVSSDWQVQLVSTDSMMQDRYYTMTPTWLNEDAGYPDVDWPIWRFKVPEGINDFDDLIAGSATNPLALFAQPTQPTDWPVGAVWLNTITGDMNRKKA